jgi:non-ribosomal peptide synthetase component F
VTTLHELVEEQARSRPDAVAVSAGGTSVGYRELDDWADTIAARLTEAGVRPGDLVAVMVPRSPTFPAAVLGILKAGAAYVPVDPDYPVLRREHLLSDAAPTAVVVGGIGIGDVRRDLPRVSAEPPDAACAPSPHAGRPRAVAADLAYVMYTSGSSGKPKGVAVEHRQVVSLALNDERIRVRPGDRVVMMAPLSFDASTFELWNTLCRGGELVVPDGTPDSVIRRTRAGSRFAPELAPVGDLGWVFGE